MSYLYSYTSPLGNILLSSDGESLTGLWFEDQKDCPPLPGAGSAKGNPPVFERAARWLDRYFSGREPDFTPPLRMTGTEFQREVWGLLLQIPYGVVTTYGELAHEIAARRGISRMAAQAVGGAVGHNPISIIVPCHRVVGANGSLIGYGGGLDRKAKLLKLEKTGT